MYQLRFMTDAVRLQLVYAVSYSVKPLRAGTGPDEDFAHVPAAFRGRAATARSAAAE